MWESNPPAPFVQQGKSGAAIFFILRGDLHFVLMLHSSNSSLLYQPLWNANLVSDI